LTSAALVAAMAVACSSAEAATARLLISPTGSDSNACTQAAPCQTFNRGYRAAKPGDVVEVAAGEYPYQQIDLDPAKTSAQDVVFRPAPGADVYVRTIALGDGLGTPAASHVTIQDIEAGDMRAFTPARDVTWTNIDAGNFYVRGVQNLLIKGGDWGPCGSRDPTCGGNSKIDFPAGEQPNLDITIDGATFHDYRIGNPDDHFECLYLAGGRNITVRNSRFSNCEFYDIYVTRINRGPEGTFAGLLIEGNRLGTPWNGQGVQNRGEAIEFSPWGTPFEQVVIRRNSFETGLSLNGNNDGSAYRNVLVTGNIIASVHGCYPTATYTDNVWTGAACGTRDRMAPFGYALGEGALSPAGVQAAVVRRVFRERAGGRSPALIARGLRAGRALAPAGKTWTAALVRELLADRAYLGSLYGARGAHPALVAPALWRRAQGKLRP
jgi:hypothetical protein